MEHEIPRPDVNKLPAVTTDDFVIESRKLFDHIYNGVLPMHNIDQINFKIEYHKHNNEIMTDTKLLNITIDEVGTWQIVINEKTQKINLFSPISYTHHYVYNKDLDSWQCTLDSHNIIELLARELNDHAQGYPHF